MQLTATVTKTKNAHPVGRYQQTEIDACKAAVEFRITGYYGNKAEIVWQDGRIERVTERKLNALRVVHTWAPDF